MADSLAYGAGGQGMNRAYGGIASGDKQEREARRLARLMKSDEAREKSGDAEHFVRSRRSRTARELEALKNQGIEIGQKSVDALAKAIFGHIKPIIVGGGG